MLKSFHKTHTHTPKTRLNAWSQIARPSAANPFLNLDWAQRLSFAHSDRIGMYDFSIHVGMVLSGLFWIIWVKFSALFFSSSLQEKKTTEMERRWRRLAVKFSISDEIKTKYSIYKRNNFHIPSYFFPKKTKNWHDDCVNESLDSWKKV